MILTDSLTTDPFDLSHFRTVSKDRLLCVLTMAGLTFQGLVLIPAKDAFRSYARPIVHREVSNRFALLLFKLGSSDLHELLHLRFEAARIEAGIGIFDVGE